MFCRGKLIIIIIIIIIILSPYGGKHIIILISLTANTHTHHVCTQHTQKKYRPCLGVSITIRCRRRRPLQSAVQSVGLPWHGSGRRASRAEHAILAADDCRDVALVVAEPVVDDGPA